MRRFKRLTWGKPLIMGRKTWDSIGRPLPGRETVVLSRDTAFRPAGAHGALDWDEAHRMTTALAADMGAAEIAVVGGAEIYRLALPDAEVLHLTLVHARPEGDTLFPAYDRDGFEERSREDHSGGPEDDHAFTFVDLVRRERSPRSP